ncbi:diacylglycerol kinase family protein [Streptomyces sp. KHY 26]|uniref:diacylglycerol kinase family protein n=1 Tax=Streptomyces sp. KHY 26 TaxID=3097359 RepID=UPI00376EC6BF
MPRPAVSVRRLDLVVVVGGDGAVREVTAGLIGHDGPAAADMAIVPAGTGDLACGMPRGERPWAASSAEVVRTGGDAAPLSRLGLVCVRGTGAHVLLGCCSGVTAETLVKVRSLPVTGTARCAPARAETAASFTPCSGRVTVDGVVLREGPAVPTDSGCGQYRVPPYSRLDDGLPDIRVIEGEVPPSGVPALAADAGRTGAPAQHGRCESGAAERRDGEASCFERDGELRRPGPRRISSTRVPTPCPSGHARRGSVRPCRARTAGRACPSVSPAAPPACGPAVHQGPSSGPAIPGVSPSSRYPHRWCGSDMTSSRSKASVATRRCVSGESFSVLDRLQTPV